MRVLITGSMGQLGSQISRTLSDEYDIIPTSRTGRVQNGLSISELDITDHEKVEIFIEDRDPQMIVNCAAMTDVDECEEDAKSAKIVNTDSVSNLAKICRKRGIKLIQISTDYVFDGENSPYSETSQRRPIQEYGKSKSAAEEIIEAEVGLDWTIVRASGIFSTTHRNFLTWVLESAKRNEEISIVTDQFSTPISALSASNLILKIIQGGHSGFWNIGSAEKISRFDFARIICEKFGINGESLSESNMNAISWKADRPFDTSFNTRKMREFFGAQDIERMIEELVS